MFDGVTLEECGDNCMAFDACSIADYDSSTSKCLLKSEIRNGGPAGPEWTSFYKYCKPGCYEYGVVYPTQDLPDMPIKTTTAKGCQEECQMQAGCCQGAYRTNGLCWLKEFDYANKKENVVNEITVAKYCLEGNTV